MPRSARIPPSHAANRMLSSPQAAVNAIRVGGDVMEIPYRPGVTTVRLTGSLDTKPHQESDGVAIRTSAQVDVSVTCEPDFDQQLVVSATTHKISDSSLKLTFAE